MIIAFLGFLEKLTAAKEALTINDMRPRLQYRVEAQFTICSQSYMVATSNALGDWFSKPKLYRLDKEVTLATNHPHIAVEDKEDGRVIVAGRKYPPPLEPMIC